MTIFQFANCKRFPEGKSMIPVGRQDGHGPSGQRGDRPPTFTWGFHGGSIPEIYLGKMVDLYLGYPGIYQLLMVNFF